MFEINFLKKKIKIISTKLEKLIFSFEYFKKKKKLKEIILKLQNDKIFNKKKIVKNLNKDIIFLNSYIKPIKKVMNDIKDIKIIIKLMKTEINNNIFFEIKKNIDNINILINNIELKKLFTKKNDILNCYIDVKSGSGGIESQDWANMIMKMYLRWSEMHKFKIKITEESKGEKIGIKSATISVIGHYAYGWLRTESGIHRMIRKNSLNSKNKIHTTFSSSFVYPEINNNINIIINESDLRIDLYRSSGSGGQHVNCTESAVRITHLPTNIITQCQNERSQHKNKKQAIKQLKSKLYKLELIKKNKNKKNIEKNKSNITWSNQIRSYFFDHSIIKDHRTGLTLNNIKSVMNGNLDKFIKASIKLGI
ncbi:MAG: peptide chain release factor 2 [Candidatus Makana argininalis]